MLRAPGAVGPARARLRDQRSFLVVDEGEAQALRIGERGGTQRFEKNPSKPRMKPGSFSSPCAGG